MAFKFLILAFISTLVRATDSNDEWKTSNYGTQIQQDFLELKPVTVEPIKKKPTKKYDGLGLDDGTIRDFHD